MLFQVEVLFELIKGLIIDLDGTSEDEVYLILLLFLTFCLQGTIAICNLYIFKCS
jgi:hypothetical protein